MKRTMSPIPMKHNITYPYEALNTQHYKTAEQSNNYKENRVYEQLRSFIKWAWPWRAGWPCPLMQNSDGVIKNDALQLEMCKK